MTPSHRTQCFRANRLAFEVVASSSELCTAIGTVFSDLADGSAVADVTIEVGGEAPEFRLRLGPDAEWRGPMGPDAIIAQLVTGVSRLELDHDPERLHLHAAGLSKNGRGVVVSARSGTGKSTLAAALASAGWTYVTDEAVAFERGKIDLTGFPKPIMLKGASVDLLPDVAERGVVVEPIEGRSRPVPVGSTGARLDRSLEPVLVVLLSRTADGAASTDPRPKDVHRADTVVRLMQETMDPERFGPDTAGLLADLAARSRCVEMPVGDLERSVSVLDSLIAEPFASATASELCPETTAVPGWEVPDSVRSFLIEDRVVVHDTNEGTIAALDVAGTAVWEALCGRLPAWMPADVLGSVGTQRFLEGLAEVGLTRRTGGGS